MSALVSQHWPLPQQRVPVAQQSGSPCPTGHGSSPPGHCWQVPCAGSVHAKPTAQQLAPHARSGGQQVEPLLRHCPLQHCPLQHESSAPQQFAPHWKFGESQQVVPFTQLCDGQHVLPQTSATLQHVTG
jgi:hypothetical protein